MHVSKATSIANGTEMKTLKASGINQLYFSSCVFYSPVSLLLLVPFDRSLLLNVTWECCASATNPLSASHWFSQRVEWAKVLFKALIWPLKEDKMEYSESMLPDPLHLWDIERTIYVLYFPLYIIKYARVSMREVARLLIYGSLSNSAPACAFWSANS